MNKGIKITLNTGYYYGYYYYYYPAPVLGA
jgi:hypothetical protein